MIESGIETLIDKDTWIALKKDRIRFSISYL